MVRRSKVRTVAWCWQLRSNPPAQESPYPKHRIGAFYCLPRPTFDPPIKHTNQRFQYFTSSPSPGPILLAYSRKYAILLTILLSLVAYPTPTSRALRFISQAPSMLATSSGRPLGKLRSTPRCARRRALHDFSRTARLGGRAIRQRAFSPTHAFF